MRPRSLTRKKDFDRVYREGRKMVGHAFVLYLLPATDDAMAVVASRKVGGAVQRNRAKRLLRPLLRAAIFPDVRTSAEMAASLLRDAERFRGGADEPETRGLWAVAVARRNILTRRFPQVLAEAEELLANRRAPSGH